LFWALSNFHGIDIEANSIYVEMLPERDEQQVSERKLANFREKEEEVMVDKRSLEAILFGAADQVLQEAHNLISSGYPDAKGILDLCRFCKNWKIVATITLAAYTKSKAGFDVLGMAEHFAEDFKSAFKNELYTREYFFGGVLGYFQALNVLGVDSESTQLVKKLATIVKSICYNRQIKPSPDRDYEVQLSKAIKDLLRGQKWDPANSFFTKEVLTILHDVPVSMRSFSRLLAGDSFGELVINQLAYAIFGELDSLNRLFALYCYLNPQASRGDDDGFARSLVNAGP